MDLDDDQVILSENELAQAETESDKKTEANIDLKRFDFRYGSVPEGVTFYRPPEIKSDEELYQLHSVPGSASHVSLLNNAFMKIDTSSLPPSTTSKFHEDWTISMEMRVSALPETKKALSLLQCHSKPSSLRETVEAELTLRPNSTTEGVVGIFDYEEKKEDKKKNLPFFQAEKWQTVTLRFGGSAKRTLDVFINGKKLQTVDKGVFNRNVKGGRFSIPLDGFLLFAPDLNARTKVVSKGVDAKSKVDVRFIQFSRKAMSEAEILRSKGASVWSQYLRDTEEAEKAVFQTLALKPLFKRPPFVWQAQAYLCEFGDAILGAAAGQPTVFDSFKVVEFVAATMHSQQQGALNMLSDEEVKVLAKSMDMLKVSLQVAQDYAKGMTNPNQLVAFVRKFRKKLECMSVGACFMVPGAFNNEAGFSPFIIILEKTSADRFRFSLVNTAEQGLEYHYSSATSAPPKFQTRQTMVFNNVEANKLLDDGWWLMLWRLGFGAARNTPEKLYNDLLPLILGQPLDAALELDNNHVHNVLTPLRTHQRSSVTGYRVLREAWTYYLLQHGVSPAHTLQVSFMYQQQFAKLVLHDLTVLSAEAVDESDIGLINLCVNHLCHVATVKVRKDDELRFRDDQLEDLRQTIEGIQSRVKLLNIRNYGASKRSLELNDPLAAPVVLSDLVHDFYDHFLRKEDVNGLAGAKKLKPSFVPIDFLLVPQQATTFDEALDALRWGDKICTLASVQPTHVKNPHFLKVALLQHLFTRVISVPSIDNKSCYWSQPMRYALQLDVILLLKRLLEHFVSSAFAINTTREFDGVKIIVAAVITTIADVFLRKIATDIPSEVSTVWNTQRFGISLSPFDSQSETVMTTVPELNIARTRVLDYWHDLCISGDKACFNWNNSQRPDSSTMNLLSAVCQVMAFPAGSQILPTYLSGESWLILKNYPEFEYFRDIVFYFKYLLGTDLKYFPPVSMYNQKMAELRWSFEDGEYVVKAFRMKLKCPAQGHRWPSFAIAQRFTAPHGALNEDDLLHIRELPDFDKQLGQRDSELILSYLTVPYMRIPLILSFFANEDHIHSLKSETLRSLLDSVVFEPSRYLNKSSASAPVFVPTKDEKQLNTAYGLLINELARSPSQVISAILRLLQLALALDTGSYFASQADIILYVLRLGTRIENFVSFVLSYCSGEFYLMELRDTIVEPEVVKFLENARNQLRVILETRFQPLLRRWIRECVARAHALQEAARLLAASSSDAPHDANAATQQLQAFRNARLAEEKEAATVLDHDHDFVGRDDHPRNMMRRNRTPPRKPISDVPRNIGDDKKKEKSNDFDALFQISSDLRAHIIMTMRNSRPAEWDAGKCQRFLSLFAFLNTRHTWNADLLHMPEPEIWEILQFCRRTLIKTTAELKLKDTNRLLENVVAVVADAPVPTTLRGWGLYAGRHQRGRFAVVESSARCALLDSKNSSRSIPVVNEESQFDMGIEFNLQISQLCLKSNHIEALTEPFSSDYDVLTVFGPRSLQCIVIEEAEHRIWFRLLGRSMDLQYWDPDTRTAPQELDREYDPNEGPRSEAWIVNLFEPIRQSYYVPPTVPVEIPFVLQSAILSGTDDIAVLTGLDPQNGGVLIEVTLCKSLGTVNISYIESVGRYFWRTQMYASDSRFSLRFLQPSWDDRRSKWPMWGRYEAGRAGLPQAAPTAIITREATLVDNLSGTSETFIPARFLYGELPQVLIDQHSFWMDDNDNIRGYPNVRDKKTGLYEHVLLIEIQPDAHKKRYGFEAVNTKITRRPLKSVRTEWTELELAELRATQELSEDKKSTGLYNEHGERKRPVRSSRELDRGVYDDADAVQLLNPLFARPDSKLRSIARCLVRIETMSHMLFWKKIGKINSLSTSVADFNKVDIVELPRLQLTLEERNGYLFSIDHSDLRICGESYFHQRPEVVRLTQGIPHSLVMVDSNDEPQVLIPLVRVVRPVIGSSPLTTELVLDRVSWTSLATKYLFLPVHVSLSFLQTPSLSSALYLLNLRFVNRDYTDCMRLVSSVGTDTVLTKEEEQVVRSISAVRDEHPDAHSLRLHLTLALMDAPEEVKSMLSWDVPDQQYLYLNKLTYVSMSSRLEKEAEKDTIDASLEQIRKEDVIKSVLRSYDEKTVKAFWEYLSNPSVASEVSFQEKKRFDEIMEQILKAIEDSLQVSSAAVSAEEVKRLIPKALQKHRSQFQRCSLRNRKRWLATPVGVGCLMEVPERAKTSNWQWWSAPTCFSANEGHWIPANFMYGTPRGFSGTQLLDEINSLIAADPPESMSGASRRLGFLFLYEVLSGSVRIKVGENDDSMTIARLMWHYYADAHQNNLWSSIISIILANPGIRSRLPIFRDNRKSKGMNFLGVVSDEQPISPLSVLMHELVPILTSLQGSLKLPTIRRRSAARPVGDRDPSHAGITVVVEASFAEIVMNGPRCFLDVYADWCGPCQAVKPHVFRVARVLHDMKVPDLIVAKCDSDSNDLGSFITENFIPVLKFYQRGQEPKLYEGKREDIAILRFLHQECKGTTSAFDFQLATDMLATLNADGYPARVPVALDKADAGGAQNHIQVFESMEDDRAQRRPKISNYMCVERTLRAIDFGVLAGLESDVKIMDDFKNELSLSDEKLSHFATQPLSCIGFQRFVTIPTQAPNAAKFDMPFDLSSHPDSKAPVCVEMLERLQEDLKLYEGQVNSARPPTLAIDVLDESIPLAHKLTLLQELEASCLTQRNLDLKWVQVAFTALKKWCNFVTLDMKQVGVVPGFEGLAGAYHYILSRESSTEAFLGVEFIIALLTSSVAEADMKQVNPFLNNQQAQELLVLTSITLCHANRVGQLNRVLTTSRKLGKMLTELHSMIDLNVAADPQGKIDLRQRLVQQVQGISSDLVSQRFYMNAERKFDPRYLVFEFIWNIVLRDAQVEMIDEFLKVLHAGGSLCRQLIMGSGKTTVIAPMLCLMLGDQKHLIVEAVPPPLLEFSRACARSSFSAILQKRVFTFSFDRSSIMTEATLKKLRRARDDAGVVITTPTAIKALLLRYIENATMIRERATKSSLANDRRYAKFIANQDKIVDALHIFVTQGILLCDEIDMLLHPLRSELNFPIGEKFPLDFAPSRWNYPMTVINAILVAERVTSQNWGEKEIYSTLPLARESERMRRSVNKIAEILNEGFELKALQKVPHLILLDREFYELKLKPELTELTICWLEAQHFDTAILQGVSLKEALSNKLLVPVPEVPGPEVHGPEAEEIAAPALTRHRSVASLSDVSGPLAKYFKMLNMCHDWLKSFFPHVLTKIDRVTFGIMTEADKERAMEMDPFMPRTRWKLGIPFISKDVPSRSSEFAHPDVVIALTFLGYRYEGLRFEDFTEIITELRDDLAKEVGPVKERKASKLYELWVANAGGHIKGADRDELHEDAEKKRLVDQEDSFGNFDASDDKEVVPLRLLKKSDEEQMRKLYDLLKRSWLVEDYYLKEMIFPTFMRHQKVKLSASGQEIGGDILFKRRVGFSGTPSSLLPVEMGKTRFQKGSDGLMLRVMTDPQHVSCEIVASNWSVTGLLKAIATQPYNTRFSALIDTGALITGLTNLEVARFLLAEGLDWCDGVVYLDDNDVKMVLVRATGRDVLLSQCGISAVKLFALYDQIHTTGTDLPFLSTFNARAVQTLGKDMVWRDYVQGAWRMRRLGRGHSIHLYVIPEVYQTIHRDLALAGLTELLPPAFEMDRKQESNLKRPRPTEDPTVAKRRKSKSLDMSQSVLDEKVAESLSFTGQSSGDEHVNTLKACAAWLVLNAMRSEKIQFQQLLIQNAANVWRKNAFHILMQASLSRADTKVVQDVATVVTATNCFSEEINFSIQDTIQGIQNLHMQIEAKMQQHAALIISVDDYKVISETLALAKQTTVDSKDPGQREIALEAEIVQEQEQEVEQEAEHEQEQKVEIEKYVDMQYSRDMEEPIHWNFDFVIRNKLTPAKSGKDLKEGENPFYQLRDFRLTERQPLELPEFLGLSVNYFNPRWTGERRLKNVVCVLEYTPRASNSTTKLGPGGEDAKGPGIREATLATPPPLLERTLSTGPDSPLVQVFELFDLFTQNEISAEMIKHLVYIAMDQHVTDDVAAQIFQEFSDDRYGIRHFSEESLRKLLLSDAMRPVIPGKHFITLSLAEAETIRRIMHLRGPELRTLGVELKLRVLTLGFVVLDSVRVESDASLVSQLPNPQQDDSYHSVLAQECLRFFDGELIFSDRAVNMLLRALHASPERLRQLWFEQVLGCRRRLRRKWQETPLNKVFSLRNELHLLRQRALVVRIRLAIQIRSLSFFDVFKIMDTAKKGALGPGEFWAGLKWLNVPVDDENMDENVVNLLRTCARTDRNLNWQDFSGMVNYGDADLDAIDKALIASGRLKFSGDEINWAEVVLTPETKKTESLVRKWEALDKKEIADAAQYEKSQKQLEKEIQIKLDREQESKDELAGIAPNPLVNGEQSVAYDFSTGTMPKKVSAFGFVEHRQGALFVDQKSFLVLPVQQYLPFIRWETKLNAYSVEMRFCLEKFPTVRQALIRTGQPVDARAAEIIVNSDGEVGFGIYCGGNKRLQRNKYHHLVLVVDTSNSVLTIYLDGVLSSMLSGNMGILELVPDGPLALDLERGLCIFASETDAYMRGGLLSSVVVHNTALNAQQVADLAEYHRVASQWSCKTCTFLNPADCSRCRSCDTPRPQPKRPQSRTPPCVVSPELSQIKEVTGVDISQMELDMIKETLGQNQDIEAIINFITSQQF